MENNNRFSDQMRPMDCECAQCADRSRFSAQYRCLSLRSVIVVHQHFMDERIYSFNFITHLVIVTTSYHYPSAAVKKIGRFFYNSE